MWGQNYPSWKHSHSSPAHYTPREILHVFTVCVVIELSVTAANTNPLALPTHIQHPRAAPDTPAPHREHLLFCSVHKPGLNPAKEYDRCASAGFYSEWRVTTAHPESIRTVHSLIAHYWKCWCFQSLCSSRTLCRTSHQQYSSRHL